MSSRKSAVGNGEITGGLRVALVIPLKTTTETKRANSHKTTNRVKRVKQEKTTKCRERVKAEKTIID
ncbi:hypothetical protein SLPG_00019 [Salicola phage CGphi29]|uniref:hypothetical protein n=1 Tax=Salicola phage CGphi29 TaxID=754067 RepID=UPI0002C0BE6D|nr:hypothetical protein SLPG_00019 [Salicola phage CGphi29]AGH31813.1 hypothetical protein SLPG_00019 [Salicola phage CGphi29]